MVAALLCAVASVADLAGWRYPLREANRNGVSRWWVRPLGVVLGAGAVGLVTGLVVPVVGVVAAAGLVVHVRARNWDVRGWAVFFAASVGALVCSW
ncbi:DoxX family protein [Saccharopolyspora griseoalba]|uniref:DoxX family protein n=1 Tax=Saccharopolyspora griseoalba TaxID=1431848 RepID=A0ABW2LG81_9PSEU